MPKLRKHHYIPVFYLKQWADAEGMGLAERRALRNAAQAKIAESKAAREKVVDERMVAFLAARDRDPSTITMKPTLDEAAARATLVATSDPIELATEIVAAFVANNAVPRVELPALFEGGLEEARGRGRGCSRPHRTASPVVSIRNSVTPDYLICLDDGRKFKSLRRHLALLGMTPEQYRRKWNLPADYPMVAPRERGIVNPGKRLLAIHLMRTSTPRSN